MKLWVSESVFATLCKALHRRLFRTRADSYVCSDEQTGLEVPQVVVLGDQSSGKSSLIESIFNVRPNRASSSDLVLFPDLLS